VRIDGEDAGWCWGRVRSVELPDTEEKAGTHLVVVWLYPSTYNGYGPDRHIDGDRYLTSPDPYKGVKNDADRADAAPVPLGDDWHIVRWGFQGQNV
jgi:hypothetical protein